MEALLSAVGNLASLGAESAVAAEARRAAILAEAEAAWRAYREGLVGLWAVLKRDDVEMEDLARPPVDPAAAEVRGAAPLAGTQPG